MTDWDKEFLTRFGVWTHEINDPTPEGQREFINHLERICRRERENGLAGSWTYDLANHRRLLRILKEIKAL